MAKNFHLEIVTPDRSVYSGDPYSLIVPAYEGTLGVMAGHAPLLCTLQPGLLTIRVEGSVVEMSISSGFMEVSPKGVIILADAVERLEDIDVQRAEDSLDRAKKRLASPDESLDYARAESDRLRAENRLRLGLRHKEGRKGP
ncbi:MAG: ATP synthase F1 subunit epsilon [Planctomycetota bacterium]